MNLFDFPTFENCEISNIIFEKELFSLDKTNDLQAIGISSDNPLPVDPIISQVVSRLAGCIDLKSVEIQGDCVLE